jgi:maltooligosyltrehalose trehalohydrolase
VQAATVSISSVSPLFKVGRYAPAIYPGATYQLRATTGEQSPISRPFPADPGVHAATSRFVLGAGDWLDAFPAPVASDLTIQPATPSSFGAVLSVQVATGNAPPYQTAAASLQGDGTWKASLMLAPDTTSCLRLLPGAGPEPTLYDWIDTGRYFTPAAGMTAFFTAEEVYGVSTQGPTPFADPPSRSALMTAAFGAAMTGSGVFATREMPQGATLVDDKVYFVLHAPHAAYARLVFCGVPDAGGKYTRQLYTMSLTQDRFYWWCAIPATVATPGSLYRFLLNDDLEVLDPAAREVLDRGSFDVDFKADPNDPSTAWSLVLNVDDVRATAHAQPWQTMGWQNLLIYEMHTECFTNLNSGTRVPFDLLVDELQPVSRLGQPGYLWALPVTAFELLPVHEFNYAVDWGYDPSFYFAVDGHYGGSAGLARFVNAAHANARAVVLDVVYNHSLGSPLMKIAPDVYTNGDYDGNQMNCGHPMVIEHFRQATLHLMHTFGVDGFRFDDTKTIATKCTNGWQFLQAIHAAIRTAGAAETGRWPYCVAENSASVEWDISNPATGVMDGQWGITESYGILDASYDSGNGGDHSGELAQDMNAPAYWGRPFYQAVRFGESHDIVSTQGQRQTRIAARPPFGQGLQVAKALGALTLLTDGIPMLFMGQEYGETTPFTFFQNNSGTPPALNPQTYAGPAAGYNGSVLAWFRQVMGLRNDSSQGLQGDANYQVVATGNRTVAFTCGANQCLFAVVTVGTPNNRQDSGWLGLPAGSAYKEILNSSWPAFAVESEAEQTNGGYDARITSGQILNLPFAGAVVLQRA